MNMNLGRVAKLNDFPWGIVSSLFTGGKAGQAPLPLDAQPSNVVTSTVQTTVSPQISPVFIQQDSPKDSPVQAASMQIASTPQASGGALPSTPITGAVPGIDSASGYLPTGTPLYASGAGASVKPEVLMAGGLILGLAILLTRGFGGKGGARRRRRKAK